MLGNLDIQICRKTTSQLSAQSLDETYIILRHVGQGKYGQVFKAQNKQNMQIVALKKIKQEKEANGFPRTAMREIHLLASLKHENIVSFQEVVVQSSKEKAVIMVENAYLVLEYMDTDLHNIMQNRVVFSLDQVRCLMFQIIDALSYLHLRNVYHRDLKRILNYILKLITYYTIRRDKQRFAILGWPMNIQIRDHKPREYWFPNTELLKFIWAEYDCSVDVWSAGILFLELIVKQSPFLLAKSESQCFQKIIDLCGTPQEGDWSDVSSLPYYHDFISEPKERTLRKYLYANSIVTPQLVDLIDRMLTLNPAKRITAREAIQHEYFQNKIFVNMPRIEQNAQPPKDPPIQKKVKQEQQSKPLIQGMKIKKFC